MNPKKINQFTKLLELIEGNAETWISEDRHIITEAIATDTDFDGLTASEIIMYLQNAGAEGDTLSRIWANVFSYDQRLEDDLETGRLER